MQDTAGGVRTNLYDILLWISSHGPAGVGRPSSDRADTTIWMHNMDANLTTGEKA